MAVLILLLSWLSPVLPAINSLPPPVNLNLTSDRFIHLLRWERGAGTPPGVAYRVSMSGETTSWLPVAGCWSVVDPLLCNLTEAFSDPSETYFTEVTAHLESQTSPAVIYRGFKPIRDTVLDPPLLSVAPCDRNLCVQLKPPQEHLRYVYENLHYKLNVSAMKDAEQFSKDSVTLDGLVLSHLAADRQYCVSVWVSDPLQDAHSHPSQPVCVVIPGPFKTDTLVWSLLIVLTLFGVSSLAFFVCAGFICLRKRPLPSTLTSLRHFEEALIFAAPCVSSFSPLYDDKSTAPPVREKRSSSTSSSESSDEKESSPESTGGGGGGGGEVYLSKMGTNLPSSSSSSSSSLISAPLSTSSDLPSHSFTPPPAQAQSAAETAPLAGHKHTLKTHTHSADRTPPTHTVCPPAGGGEEVRDSLNVNLLTLTFKRDQEEEEEEEEQVFSSSMNPFLLPQSVAVETVPLPEDEEDEEEEEEEEEEEPSGYFRR